MDLLFLHGPAASGKLTTARAVEDLVGLPVFHNHLVVDTLTTVFPFGTDAFVRLRERFWLDVFAEAAEAGRSLSFTFTPESTVLAGFADRVRDVVSTRGSRVCFVGLRVGESAQEQRIDAPDRHRHHKLTDLETLRRSRSAPGVVEQPPSDLVIDTERSEPASSARRIVEHFGLAQQPRLPRY